ncbi:MAG: hypothetical protein Q7K37_09500, partial [Dehalococcoidia bacterium]|nr:hypothetical protein [Dehalococcoidia bacterium]
ALLAAAGAAATFLAACGSDDPDLLESATGPAIAVGVQTGGGLMSLEIDGYGLEPGGEYLALLHAGTCEAAGASAGRLGTLQADGDGRATLTTSTVLVGAVGAPTDLTPALLSDGDHVVRVVRVGDDEAVCVAVP